MDLRFAVQTKIQKPAREVFDAVRDPRKLSAYFTTGGSDGPLDEGRTVHWTFQDGAGQPVTVPVKVQKVVKDSLIRFTWEASEGEFDPKAGKMPRGAGYDNVVDIIFEPLGSTETLVKITEGQWRSTEDGLKASYQNCQGRMHMGAA